MRFVRIVSVCLIIVLLMCIHGCKNKQSPEKTTAKSNELIKVSFYNWNVYTRYWSVDFNAHTITVLRHDLNRKWGFYKTSIDPSDENRLRTLINNDESRLRNFNPQSEWFKGMAPPDMGAILAIEWGDTHVCYAIPPDNLRTGLDKAANQVYQNIDAVSEMLGDMADGYEGKAKIVYIERNDNLMKKIEHNLDQELDRSLPKDRVGW